MGLRMLDPGSLSSRFGARKVIDVYHSGMEVAAVIRVMDRQYKAAIKARQSVFRVISTKSLAVHSFYMTIQSLNDVNSLLFIKI
jgi:hypothetical protein